MPQDRHRGYSAATLDKELAHDIPDAVVIAGYRLQGPEQADLLAGQLEQEVVSSLLEMAVHVELVARGHHPALADAVARETRLVPPNVLRRPGPVSFGYFQLLDPDRSP
jgi:hypothetical protein